MHLTTLIKGMKTKVARVKLQRGINVEYGRRLNEHIFCHAILALEWNLMIRANNVCNTNINHLGWRHDPLLIFLNSQKETKKDQIIHNLGISTVIHLIPP